MNGTARPHLAASLAVAVAQGHLPVAHARAALAAAILTGVRNGTLDGNGTVAERIDIDNHILNLHLEAADAAEAKATGAIQRILKPLIGIGAPRNRLMAEAFNANEDHGSPLSEQQVAEAVKTRVFWAIQRGHHHAR